MKRSKKLSEKERAKMSEVFLQAAELISTHYRGFGACYVIYKATVILGLTASLEDKCLTYMEKLFRPKRYTSYWYGENGQYFLSRDSIRWQPGEFGHNTPKGNLGRSLMLLSLARLIKEGK